VIAVFEQHQRRSRSDVFAELLKGGGVGVIEDHATDLSIDEILSLMMHEIERLGATRVVIDSLSGFELAVAPTFREDFRESLARMVAALSSTGVTAVMTCELEDRYGDLRFSPYSSAFMTDAIIVQRYIEVDSQLRRLMAVVKVRGSGHSHELREFIINENGIKIGDMLPDQEGLLGGRPTKKNAVIVVERGTGTQGL
jgi:circadian clock protein KaiC